MKAMHRVTASGVAGLLILSSAANGRQLGGGKTEAVAISFALVADGKLVGCGAPLANLGAGHLQSKLQEARFYVHGVKLIDASGKRTPISLVQNDWQYADVALLDFKDARGGNAPCTETNPAKNTTVVGAAPKGAYVGLDFSVDAPVESVVDGQTVSINHSNVETAPPPLDIAGMAWNWQAGRRFLGVEVIPPSLVVKADGAKARGWMVHLGSTGCKGNPATGEIVSCAHQNRFDVGFDRFDPRTQRVDFDLTALFDGSDLLSDKGGAVGCMSAVDDPECVAIFRQLGLNLAESAPGAGDAGKQTTPGVSPVFKIGGGEMAKVVGGKQ